MPPKKTIVKGGPVKAKAAPAPPVPAKKVEEKKKVPPKKVAKEDDEVEERGSPDRRRVTGRRDESDKESPAVAAARAMQVTPSPGKSSPSVASPQVLAKRPVPGRLNVQFHAANEGNGREALYEGLVRLRRNSQLCDVTIISGFGRIPAHRTVLAAHSEKLAVRLEAQSELDLQPASHEAVDLVVRWLYGEVGASNFQPTTSQVNKEVLKISSELGLPTLSELCAVRLAEDADTSNVVDSVRLCEEYGLPKLRAALVSAVVEDPLALDAVAKDATTLTHPVLMQQLLASIAAQA